MDDFLHNLRSGKLKQQDRGRRDYSDYKGPQRRANNERRRPDYYTKVTNENFSMVRDSLSQLTETQKRLGEALSTLDKTGARIADALETIVELMVGKSEFLKDQSSPSEPAEVSSTNETPDNLIEREEKAVSIAFPSNKTKLSDADKPRMLEIVGTLRSENKSWEKIAHHIEDLNIPTVSGKGKWRGQAIKKFYDANS